MSDKIAIIGGGISSLALALALTRTGVAPASSVTIYESRAAPLDIGGAVMLCPNALRVLDRLGVYTALASRGFAFSTLEFRDVRGGLVDTYDFGDPAEVGYPTSRVYRHELVEVLLQAVRNIGVAVRWGWKFRGVVAETADGVVFESADGARESAALLVGADGIHSTVRGYLYPDLRPRYIGQVGVTAAVPASVVPADDALAGRVVTIVSPMHGGFVVAPQRRDGSELLVGMQRRVTFEDGEGGTRDPTRADWDAVHADRAASVAFLRSAADGDRFGALPTALVEHVRPETVNVWPFYVVPRLERWVSAAGRVMLVGDAAHAIPPSAGQGISQAVEDVFMLALLLGEVSKGKKNRDEALEFWQRFRQDRVDRVLELNGRVDRRRVPRGDREGAPEEVQKEDWRLGWLYGVDIEEVVKEWAGRDQ